MTTDTAENTELLAENEELRQRAEDAEIESSNLFNLLAIIRELSSVTDFNELLVTILDVLVGVVGSFRHSIIMADEHGKLEIVIQKHGDDIIAVPKPIRHWGIINSAIKNQETFCTDDIEKCKETDIIACIPLFFKDRNIGVIVMHELLPQKTRFEPSDLEILDLIAQQAGIALVSSKQFETTKQIASRKENIIKRIQAISFLISSSQDLIESFDIILGTIKELLGSNIVSLMLYDDIEGKLVLRHGIGIDEEMINRFTLAAGSGLSGYVHKNRGSILIKNVQRELHFSHLIDSEDMVFYGNSILAAPILVKNKSIGVITVSSTDSDIIFDVEEKNLLTTIASQIAFALDNLYLNERLESELMNMSNLFIASNQLHSTLDLEEIYQIAEELLVNFIGADVYSLFTYDKNRNTASMVLSRGFEIGDYQDIPVKPGDGKFSEALLDGESFIAEEGKLQDINIGGRVCPLVVSIPLVVTNKVAGVIIINSLLPHKKELVSFDREMFDLMAQHTATAIISAQLYSKSEQRLTTLYDITRLLSTNINLAESLTTIVKLIHLSLGADSSMSGVYILDRESREKRVIASEGCSDKELESILSIDRFVNAKTCLLDIMEGKRCLGKLFAGKSDGASLSGKETKMLGSVANMIKEIMSFETHLEYSKTLAVSLDKEKRQSKAIVNGVSDGLFVVDKDFNTLLLNPVVETLFGVTEEDVLFKSMFSFVKNSDLSDTVKRTFTNGPRSKEILFEKDGAEVVYNIVSSTIKDDKGCDFGVVSVLHDITKEKELEKVRRDYVEKLKKISITDALTGVFNRGYMESRVSAEFKRAKRLAREFSCMILDIDKFKNINDTYGHNIGDDMIVYMANVLTEQVRESDIVTRFGGDEFVVILPDTPANSAKIVGERIRTAARSQEFSCNNEKYSITVSVGVAGYRSSDENPESLLKRADLGLYAAKEAGRDNVQVYDDSDR